MNYQDWWNAVGWNWDIDWTALYDYWSQPPPLFWLILGAVLMWLVPVWRHKMTREDMVRRIVSDKALDMLEELADKGVISWTEAEREMIRMGRNFAWGDLIPRRTKEYHLTSDDIKQLKGIISARRQARKANGQDKPANIPGDPPEPIKKKKLLAGRIGQLVTRLERRPM